jgi:hypothetical protein
MPQETQSPLLDDSGGSGAARNDRTEAPLKTIRLNGAHCVRDFTCDSERVTCFIREKAALWVERRYCGVFVLSDPNDPTNVLGFYTLSQYVLSRDEMTNRHRSIALQKDMPLVLIGYMGRNRGTQKGLGAALVVDAARRAYRSLDIPAVGLAVEPEGGIDNPKLWAWYGRVGFTPAKTIKRLMYGPYEAFIPELSG